MEYKGFYVTITEDCDENEGGYYCEVYSDEDLDDMQDYFCIHVEELDENEDVEFWMKKYVEEYHIK